MMPCLSLDQLRRGDDQSCTCQGVGLFPAELVEITQLAESRLLGILASAARSVWYSRSKLYAAPGMLMLGPDTIGGQLHRLTTIK